MGRVRALCYLAVLLVWLPACGRPPDREAMKAEILQLHRELIRAHLTKDTAALLETYPPDFISVSNGDVRTGQRDEILASLKAYISATTFTDYRDLDEPIVGLSDDGSLAWSIVRVKVAGTRANADGSTRDVDFTCAWITLFRRSEGRWERLVEASSFR
jgi:hypothetical protein